MQSGPVYLTWSPVPFSFPSTCAARFSALALPSLSPPQDICPCSRFNLEASYLLLFSQLPPHSSALGINATSLERPSLTSQLKGGSCLCSPSSSYLHLHTLTATYSHRFTCSFTPLCSGCLLRLSSMPDTVPGTGHEAENKTGPALLKLTL